MATSSDGEAARLAALRERLLVCGGELDIPARRVLTGVPAIAQSVALFSRDDVKVDVLDSLSGDAALVEQDVEALRPGHLHTGAAEKRKHRTELTQDGGRRVGRVRVVVAWNDQEMPIGKRTDI